MYCNQCGTKIEPGNKFCAKCGARIYSRTNTEATAPTPILNGANLPKKRNLLALWIVLGVIGLTAISIAIIIGISSAKKSPASQISTAADFTDETGQISEGEHTQANDTTTDVKEEMEISIHLSLMEEYDENDLLESLYHIGGELKIDNIVISTDVYGFPSLEQWFELYIDNSLIEQNNDGQFIINSEIFTESPKTIRIDALSSDGEVLDSAQITQLMVYDASDENESVDVTKVYSTAESLLVFGYPGEDLQILSGMTQLKCFFIFECDNIVNINALSELKNLEYLDISYCHDLDNISTIQNLKGLELLRLTYCDELGNIDPISSLTELSYLDLRGSENIYSVAAISNMNGLEYLNLYDINLRESFNPENLVNLKYLNLGEASGYMDFSFLLENELKYLNLQNVTNINEPLSYLYYGELEYLNLNGCGLKDLSFINKADRLRFLDVRNSYGDTSVNRVDYTVLNGLSQLEYLYISDTYSCAANATYGMGNLRYLSLEDCYVQNMDAFYELSKLETLILDDCNQMDDMSGLAGLVNLKELYLYVSNDPIELSYLDNSSMLEKIVINYCSIHNLQALGQHKALTYLSLNNTHIEDISGLVGLDNLEYLDISENSLIYDIDVLLELSNLKTLNIIECYTIKKESSAVEVLEKLKSMGCNIIE